ncbi:hypothetical protein GCM10023094_13560 [Rhodococcus olei]|uniref:DUF222 domain-containing protein n=1 Tax=Rhodococcus olei TaxID=2161675 RepID=A0ABP8NZE0_9NOCA
MAESFAAVGIDLRLRLPRTRAAFETGDLDLARVRSISRETAGLSAATVTALEPQILAAARHLSPGPLAGEIERLVAAHSPDEAAEQREDVQRFSRRVVKRSGRGCSTVEVTVTPQEGEAIMQLVAEFAGTACRHDRRGAQEKLVDSVPALAHREPYLECSCGRDDCEAPKTDALPGRRAPLTQITVDPPTLIGLLSEPAYLHGHGLIDPDFARQLAANGTWRAMLTEVLDLAEELGLLERNTGDGAGGGHYEPSTDEDPSPSSEGPTSPSGQSLTRDTPTSPPPRFCVRSFLARGSRRTAGPIPETRGRATSPPPQRIVPTSVGTMAEAVLAAVRANPALARGALRDGHGGLIVPPAGALTYRPDAATAALVRARDRHCRFPGCTRPAAQCQLDHIVEYLAWNPVAGGWTVVSNLQCLCAFHHQLKTLGLWHVVALGDPRTTGHALLWTSTRHHERHPPRRSNRHPRPDRPTPPRHRPPRRTDVAGHHSRRRCATVLGPETLDRDLPAPYRRNRQHGARRRELSYRA